MSLMTRGSSEFRCPECGALLGVRNVSGFNIKRGDMQAAISGDFQLSIVCWRSRCQKLTVLRFSAPASPPLAKV